jgi:acetyl/propionyl-CoA carboxylase alpha subunit
MNFVFSSKRLRGFAGADEHADSLAEMAACRAGRADLARAVLSSGDGVLVVEAMKMQNELKSSKAGTVRDSCH